MFRFITQKILNKKWLISCLLIGTFLLIAIACCNPMYTSAALQKMLTDQLEEQMTESNKYPSYVKVYGTLSDSRFKLYSSEVFPEPYEAAEKLGSMYSHESLYNIRYFETPVLACYFEQLRENQDRCNVSISNMSDMGEHVNIIYGDMYSEEPQDGIYECIISESVLTSSKILIGDVITTELTDKDNKPIKLKVTGVFGSNKDNDLYWINDPLDYDGTLFISDTAFKNIFMTGDGMIMSVDAEYYSIFDYRTIKTSELNDFIAADNIIREDSKNNGLYQYEFPYEESISTYRGGSTKVVISMWIFQIPVLILLCVFIFMVSNQIISVEQSEIAMLKSRGVSRKQMILSYLLQGTIISLAGIVIGLPLGYLFCVIFGQTKSFLEFSVRSTLEVHFTLTSVIYAIIAALAAIIIMTLPVFKYANFSIVEQKTNKKKKKKPLWQKVWLDFILLLVSLYGLYQFSNQKDAIIEKINNGGALDPLLYFSSTVFILSGALILLRFVPLLLSLIYRIGMKKWKPATYAAFMQINKSIRKQGFIIVFLVLTLALGIFNATTARSINDNEESRIYYDNGAVLTLKQTWKSNISAIRAGYREPPIVYEEPDDTIYRELEGSINAYTKVIYDTSAGVSSGTDILKRSATFMAITTDEFGLTAYMPDDVTEIHWYNYLNEIAKDPYGAVISKNYADVAGLSVGDTFTVYRTDELGSSMSQLKLNVAAIVEVWPGYESKVYGKTADGSMDYLEHYLVVCNMETARKTYGIEPYEIWINCDETQPVYDFAENNGLSYTKFVDATVLSDQIKEEPFFQVTSGMLTITFVVILILSMIGFLIYWITSIKSRELIFGIYRAMGMSMKEIIHMLVCEHLFGSVLPILYGVFIGIFSAKLFVPLIQLAYSPTYSALPSEVITGAGDMIRIAICVVAMLAICFFLLARILSSMKIAQALKLGED